MRTVGRSVGWCTKQTISLDLFCMIFMLSGHQICVYVYQEAKNKSQQNNNRNLVDEINGNCSNDFHKMSLALRYSLSQLRATIHRRVKQHTTYARIPTKTHNTKATGNNNTHSMKCRLFIISS